MGMDLMPRNNDCSSFHASWAGWRFIGTLLIMLGCDIDEMDGVNDGRYVKARTARSWGRAVQKALEKGTVFVKEFNALEIEVATAPERMAELVFDGYSPIKDETKQWLVYFADFCISSSGFWQY